LHDSYPPKLSTLSVLANARKLQAISIVEQGTLNRMSQVETDDCFYRYDTDDVVGGLSAFSGTISGLSGIKLTGRQCASIFVNKGVE
jgi:hypothetical protein